ncbi:porin [Curvibacter sp. HBC61]|uniref:Porin n=1 Tax=Curvibacter cyanobacteriorum TaxID=3026422 RepID=A0ABT5MX21_9BURK|nr:porin [Curvibacter sp. HBC61]MDD0838609.1 porin [Curvibacter sp. HBC61]
MQFKYPLLTGAILGVASLAPAHAAVHLFGVLDLSYETVQTGSGRVTGLAPSGNSSSALGLRGSEDLGAGLAANFWLEGGLNPANGSGPSGSSTNNQTNDVASGGFLFNRRATVSLSSDYGELRLGRDTTPTWQNYGNNDPFNGNGVGTLIASYTGSASANTFLRASNAVGYFLPKMSSGVYGQAMLASGNHGSNAQQDGVDTSGNGRYAGARLGIQRDRFDVAVAYGQTRYAPLTQTLGSNGLAGSGTQGGSTVTRAGEYTDTNLGASYQFDRVKVMTVLAKQTLNDLVQAGNQQSTRAWSLGLQAPFGNTQWLASFSSAKLDGAKAQKLALGAVYNLSKRSAVYTTVARVQNSGGASISASSYGAGALSPVMGSNNVNHSSTGLDVGVRVSF